MPRKPKRPCAYPGCPELTDGRYCAEHQKIVTAHYNRYERDPASRKRYGRAWKRIRDSYIAEHPLCEQCQRDGKLTPAEEVHHIQPLALGGSNDKTNLQLLCPTCNLRKGAKPPERWAAENGRLL